MLLARSGHCALDLVRTCSAIGASGVLSDVKLIVLKPNLVGGLEHVFPYIGKNYPNWLIFFESG